MFLKQFHTFATPVQGAFLRETVSGQAVEEVKRMEALAVGSIESGTTGGVEAPRWFDTITVKIDRMKTVEDRLASDLIVLADTPLPARPGPRSFGSEAWS